MASEALNLGQLATLRIGSLGLTFKVQLPTEIDVWAEHTELPAGTLLLSPGTGGWAYAERYVIHDRQDNLYRAVDLARGIVVPMNPWEVAASFVQLISDEPYPYTSIEQAQAAARQGIMLFSPPVTASA